MFFGSRKRSPLVEYVSVRVLPLKSLKEVRKEFKRATKGTILKKFGNKYLDHVIEANTGFHGRGDCCSTGTLVLLCQRGESRTIANNLRDSKVFQVTSNRDYNWSLSHARAYAGAKTPEETEQYLVQNYWGGHSFEK